jgi:hypothetical protein
MQKVDSDADHLVYVLTIKKNKLVVTRVSHMPFECAHTDFSSFSKADMKNTG